METFFAERQVGLVGLVGIQYTQYTQYIDYVAKGQYGRLFPVPARRPIRAPPRAPVTSPGPRKTPVCPPPGPNHAQKAPPAPMDSPLEPGLAPMPGASLPMSLRQAPARRSRCAQNRPGNILNTQNRAIPKLHGRKCTESTIFQACFVPRAGKPTIPPVQCPPAGHPVTAAGLLDTACRSALDRSRAPVRYPVPTCTCTVVRHEKFLTTAHRPHLSCADAPPGGQNRPRT